MDEPETKVDKQRPGTHKLLNFWFSSIFCEYLCLKVILHDTFSLKFVQILPICASLDEDYRSSRNIAISLFRRYRNVVDRGGAENLKVSVMLPLFPFHWDSVLIYFKKIFTPLSALL